MPHDDDDLRALWQSAPAAGSVSLDELRKRERALSLRVKVRNGAEYVAAAFVVVAFTFYAVRAPSLGVRASSWLTVLATAFVVWKLRRDGSPLPPPALGAPLGESLAHHRASLVRQRDLLRTAPLWYVGPFVVPMVLFQVSVALERSPGAPFAVLMRELARPLFVSLLVFAAIAFLNVRAAGKLDAKIESLKKVADDL